MPELPEVETVRSGLVPYLEGQRIAKLILNRPDLRAPIPADLPKRVAGRLVHALERHGKTMLWRLENGPDLAWHLGMSGSFRVEHNPKAEPRKHDHVRVMLESGTALVFNDPRRFGSLGYAPQILPGLDPVTGAFTPAVLAAMAAGRKSPVKTFLLDQRHITGIGNIYASEALFQARIHPERETGTLTKAELRKLHGAIVDVLARAIVSGGSSLRDHVMVDGNAGYFQHSFAVYGRAGQPCQRCRNPVQKSVQAGRATFFCANCQA